MFKVDSTSTAISEESKEKCRYWPNCTLGKKCAYYHPPISCRLISYLSQSIKFINEIK